jgi:acyl-lipid omega-6 desaturase (Delta-12 desaturase)
LKRPEWFDKLSPYAAPDSSRSIFFLLTSVPPYLVLFSLMLYLRVKGFPYWMVLILAVPASSFYIRTFIILHDCSHLSFIGSKKFCNILGHVCGLLTLTPFFDWQRNHGHHHANVGNLDKRGIGDIWTMTFEEYRTANLRAQLQYRLFRNPYFLFLIAPPVLFAVLYRFPQKSTRRKDYFSIAFTDVVLALLVWVAFYTVGIKNFLAVQLPILLISTPIGMWLFYVQHQFENVYWAHEEKWDLISASIKGASFYKLPGLLRWVTGNIGYHNLHHLKPRIPCYNLKECYDAVSELHYIQPFSVASSFRALPLALWHEEMQKLISFKAADRLIAAPRT